MAITLTEVITIEEYLAIYPQDTAVEEDLIQSAINRAIITLDAICGGMIAKVWPVEDINDPLYRTPVEKDYIKKAHLIQAQWNVSRNNDMTAGTESYTSGSNNYNETRPQANLVADEVIYQLLAQGRVYNPNIATETTIHSGFNAGDFYNPTSDIGDNYVTYNVGDNRYVPKHWAEAKNKFAKWDNNGNITAVEGGEVSQIQADWNQTDVEAISYIRNKPNLATVATTGSYNDLINQPTITIVEANPTLVGTEPDLTSILIGTNKYKLATGGGVWGSITGTLSNQADLQEALDYKQNKIWQSVTVGEGEENYLTMLSVGQFERRTSVGGGATYYYLLPLDKGGTFAMTSDIVEQVNSDWNALSGKAQILNKPSLASVATSGDYNDLSNKPTNLVTTDTNQNITAPKTFVESAGHEIILSTTDNTIKVKDATNVYSTIGGGSILAKSGSTSTLYKNNGIFYNTNGNDYTIDYPLNSGTLALFSDIPTISVSDTGTATDEVRYITINGVEKKLAGSGGGTWGSITGTLSNQTDLQTALDSKIAKTTTIETVWSGTLAEYNAITTKDPKTLYNITDDNASFSLQAFYDGLYPVNNIQFGLQAPNVPNGITATWTDISSTYEGRYFKVSSTDTLGTSQAEQLPNIWGRIGCLRNSSLKEGCFSASFGTTDWQTCADGGYPTGQYGYNVGVFNAHNSNATYIDGGAVRPLTTTIKVWKRTA